ncbi:MAG: hypothetical protein AABX51_09075 [Nanoarchaeota archaeon]
MPTMTIRGVNPTTRKKMKEISAQTSLPMGRLLEKMAVSYDPSKEDFISWLENRKSVLTAKDAEHMKKVSKDIRKGKWARWN